MHRSVRASVLAPVVTGVLAASAIAFAGSAVHGDLTPQQAPKHLRLHGHVANLQPGRARTFAVMVWNPLPAGVVVHEVRGRVRRGDGPSGRCPARFLHVRRWHGTRRVPAGARRAIHLTVRLRSTAPARCWGARWPIHYVARSVRP